MGIRLGWDGPVNRLWASLRFIQHRTCGVSEKCLKASQLLRSFLMVFSSAEPEKYIRKFRTSPSSRHVALSKRPCYHTNCWKSARIKLYEDAWDFRHGTNELTMITILIRTFENNHFGNRLCSLLFIRTWDSWCSFSLFCCNHIVVNPFRCPEYHFRFVPHPIHIQSREQLIIKQDVLPKILFLSRLTEKHDIRSP